MKVTRRAQKSQVAGRCDEDGFVRASDVQGITVWSVVVCMNGVRRWLGYGVGMCACNMTS